jgi:hypothetical protein
MIVEQGSLQTKSSDEVLFQLFGIVVSGLVALFMTALPTASGKILSLSTQYAFALLLSLLLAECFFVLHSYEKEFGMRYRHICAVIDIGLGFFFAYTAGIFDILEICQKGGGACRDIVKSRDQAQAWIVQEALLRYGVLAGLLGFRQAVQVAVEAGRLFKDALVWLPIGMSFALCVGCCGWALGWFGTGYANSRSIPSDLPYSWPLVAAGAFLGYSIVLALWRWHRFDNSTTRHRPTAFDTEKQSPLTISDGDHGSQPQPQGA